MTILCVDDDMDDLELLREAIEEIDSSVVCLSASTGQEAMNLLGNGLVLPNLIFLDINMPLMNGVTCLAKIRENKKFDNIKVVFLSTSLYALNKEKMRSLTADFFTKPVRYSDLVGLLRAILSRARDE